MSIQNLVRGAARRLARSWRKHPLVMGMMMGLTLNMSLIPALQPISAVAAPPAGQAGQVEQADPMVPIDDLIATHKSVWETLFESGWSSDHWTYPLEKEVTDLGDYSGANDFGEPFNFTVVSWTPVDTGSVDLPPDQKAWASEHEYRSGGVVGLLKTDRGSVAVYGTAVRVILDGVEHSRFLLDGTTDADGPLFTAGAEFQQILDRFEKEYEVTRAELESQFEGTRLRHAMEYFELLEQADQIQYAAQQGADPACVAGCYATYNDAVAQANAAYNIAVQNAAAGRDAAIAAADAAKAAAIAAANAAFAAAKTAADNSLAICMGLAIAVQMGCRIAGLGCGFFVLACQLVCSAVFAASVAACIGFHRAAITAATTTLTTAIAAANAAHAAAVAAANATYNAALTAASLTLNNAINAAAAALRACLAGCGAPQPPIVQPVAPVGEVRQQQVGGGVVVH